MLNGLLGGLIDAEGHIRTTITTTLDNLSEELKVGPAELFVMIQPVNDDFEFKLYVFKKVDKIPVFVREISLKEVISS